MLNVRLNLRKVATIAACLAVTTGFVSCKTEDDDGTKVPGAVENFTATAGDGQVGLAWEAPSKDGGSTITGYEVTMGDWANKEEKSASQLSHTYTGLTNGTEYTFKVRAINSKGAGTARAEKATPKPATEEPSIAFIIGDWLLTHEEGYEIYNGDREEWNRDANWLSVYTFNSDNTGLHSYNDGDAGEWSFTWQYASSNRNLIVVSDGDPDYPFSYTIEKLNINSLVLVLHNFQDNYEYYQKSTYERTQ